MVTRFAGVGVEDRRAPAHKYSARNEALQMRRRLHHRDKLLIPPVKRFVGRIQGYQF